MFRNTVGCDLIKSLAGWSGFTPFGPTRWQGRALWRACDSGRI